jgi:hypothetical protein
MIIKTSSDDEKELAVLVKVDTWKRRSNPNAVGHPE